MKHTVLAIFGLFILSSCKTIVVDQPSVQVVERPQIVQPVSTIHVPVQLNLKPYFDQIEQSIPKKIKGSEQNCEGVSYSYEMFRKPIEFSGRQNQLDYNVRANYSLKLNYCPSCTFTFNSDGNCIIPRVYATCGVNEQLRGMEISYSSAISISNNWSLKSTTKLRAVNPLNPCKITFVNYDATDILVQEVTTELRKKEREIDSTLAGVDLKPMISKVWNALNEPINLKGYGYLHLNPAKIGLDQIQFQKQQANVNLTLEMKPKVNFDLKGSNQKLPNLSEYVKKDGFEMILDIEARYDSLDQILARHVVGTTMEIKGKQVVFEGVQIHSTQNQKITIAVQISGSKRGTIFFSGTPVFHVITQELSIPDLTFDVKTKSVLLKSAKWLFSDRIEQKMRDACRLNLQKQLQELKNTIETEMNGEIENGVILNGKIHALEIQDVYPFIDQFFIRVLLKGEVELKL